MNTYSVGRHWQVFVVQNVLANVQVALAAHVLPVSAVAASTKNPLFRYNIEIAKTIYNDTFSLNREKHWL